jgi:hypothetical protein
MQRLPLNCCVDGRVFNEVYYDITFYKVLPESMVNERRPFTYQVGLNVDHIPFDPTGECKPGGLYFTERRWIQHFFYYGGKIAEVHIPDDAKVYIELFKYKASKIVLTKIVAWSTLPWWDDQRFCDKCISVSPFTIKYIINQSTDLCKRAISINPNCIEFIRNQAEEVCKYAIKCDPDSIRYIRNQTNHLSELAIKLKPSSIKLIRKQTIGLCKLAISLDPLCIEHIKSKSNGLCYIAIKGNHKAIQYINSPNRRMKMLASLARINKIVRHRA